MNRESQPAQDQGKQEDESALPLPIHKQAMANSTPFGESITTTAGFGVPGVFQIGPDCGASWSNSEW